MENIVVEIDPLSNDMPNFEEYAEPYVTIADGVKPPDDPKEPSTTDENKPKADVNKAEIPIIETKSNISCNDVLPVPEENIKKEPTPGPDQVKTEPNLDSATAEFPYYGCAVCNISYQQLSDLDQHVIIHKDRVTSWDLRVKAMAKKRKIKKALKMKLDIKDIKIEEEPKSDMDKCLEKIFKCASCYKQFSLSYYLKLHVRSHTGEKPYQCCQCGMSFITASKLGRHRKLHTTVRFECRICHKQFTRFENLTKHFDKKHAEDKLDGEPYDYNAILPYLKELEEQLKTEKKSETPDEFQQPCFTDVLKTEVHIKMEEIEVKMENEELYQEPEPVAEMPSPPPSPAPEMPFFDDTVKDEDDSDDEDYFPLDTWATTDMPDDIPDAGSLSPDHVKPVKAKRKKQSATPLDDINASGDPLRCGVCDKRISSASYLRVHMRTHTGERPFRCYLCQKGFITSSKMHRHVLTHIDRDAAREDAANLKSDEIAEIKVKSEWNDADKDKEGVEEKTPTKRKRRRRNVIPNLTSELPPERQPKKRRRRPHACDYCQKRFLHLDTLQVHVRTHQGEEKVISCHFCLEKFDTDELLNDHLVSHTGPNPYLCTLCGKKYKRKETMVYHRRLHKMEKKYQCDVCSKSFIAPCKLQRHLLSHRPGRFAVRFECPVCAHVFNTKYHVQMHLATHEKDGLIQKENRGQVLAMVLQNARKIPMQSDIPYKNLNDLMPPDDRSRVCNICGEVFHHFFYLEEHLKTHGSKFEGQELKKSKLEDLERRYKCQVCNKGFKLHYYLKLHNFTHTKEKPFICQQCGKGFITKGKLKRHLESHTGLKKYQCHICCKFFTRPSYLRIHVKTIHGKSQEYRLPRDGYGMPCMTVLSDDIA